MDLNEFLKHMASHGIQVMLPASKHLSLGEAAKVLDVSATWVREHLSEFPNAWRLPGAGRCGEWRIPSRDIDALAASRRLGSP